MTEYSLHSEIKDWYMISGDELEVKVDGFIVDILRDKQLIEIQTGNFSAIKKKLIELLLNNQVRLVYPIAKLKWIVHVSKSGEFVRRRKSPKKGKLTDLFYELVHTPSLIRNKMHACIVNILGWYTPHLRTKKGGTHWEHGTIILIKDGPYAIIRHHGIFALTLWLPMFTIALSNGIPFTILSIIGNILFFIGMYYLTVGEEELNVEKCGDEYRQYQKEIPRFNFILGIRRWAKRKRK
jgi:hypothetical protein